jgi:hypothetical protein
MGTKIQDIVVSLGSKVQLREKYPYHIKKKVYMNNRMTNEFNQFTETAYNTSRNERPIYKNFSASKMSQCVKPNSLVEFTDFMGRVHKVSVRNNTELKKQMKFFGMLKRESSTIKQIIASYPIKLGKVEKRFLAECKRELKSVLKLTNKQMEIVLG